MGHEMAMVVHQRLSLLGNGGSSSSKHVDNDAGFEPTDKELAIVVGQQSKAIEYRDDEFVPLRIVRPTSEENGQEKRPGFPYKHGAKKTSTRLTKAYKRKREMPVGSKSGKSKMEEKTTFVNNRSSSKSKKDNANDFDLEVSDDDGPKKYACANDFYGTAWDKAVELNEKLPTEGPSFVKLMLKSHVVKGFWLGLPHSFCRSYLPDHDVTITLVDEEGNIYGTNYLANRMGLSGGWNRFAVQHDLNVGDAVVFQLVRTTRFKVYILRENKFTATDGELGLDTSVGSNTLEEKSSDEDANSEENPKATRFSGNAFGGDSTNLASKEADDDSMRTPYLDMDFDAVKNFRQFNIVLDSLDTDPELFPDRLRRTYYQLCCARMVFLHRHLKKHISTGLVAGLIMETAHIAERIRAFNASSSSLEDLAAWKKILGFLKLAGMDVAFLRKRIGDLQVAVEEKLEQDHAAEKMIALKSKISSLNDAPRDLCMDADEMVESIVKNKKKKEQAIRELAITPW